MTADTQAAPTGQAGPVYTLQSHQPFLGAGVFIAPNAAVVGRVEIGDASSVWFSAVVRGDEMPVCIGRNTNIQDGAIIHATEGVMATLIGDDVVIGHGAIVHGATIGDRALIGMGAILLDGAVVEPEAVVAAGAIVPSGKCVPAWMLWLGNPGGVRRAANEAEHAFVREAVAHYRTRAGQYLADRIGATGAPL